MPAFRLEYKMRRICLIGFHQGDGNLRETQSSSSLHESAKRILFKAETNGLKCFSVYLKEHFSTFWEMYLLSFLLGL